MLIDRFRGGRERVAMLAVLVVLGACTGADGGEPPGESPQGNTPAAEQRGGTLRLGALGDSPTALDPQKQQDQFPFHLYRCCLLRALVQVDPSGSDEPTIVGDIAEGPPEVSADGLSLTFQLRSGVTFGPPIEREVTSEDFVTAFERALNPETLAFNADLFSAIEGAAGYMTGEADTISGLRTPDPRTLVIELSEPDPVLVPVLADPTVAPIPAEAAEGHEKDYGRFLISTGPYMVEGIDEVDFTLPPDEQEPASGYVPAQSLTLVRNPAWQPESDPLRGDYAFVDRMEVTIGGTANDYAQKIERGELDIQIDGFHPAELLRTYATDPELSERLVTHDASAVGYASLTVAAPPFDDVHVRRAVNWVVDKAAIARILGGELNAKPAHHVWPDLSLGNLLEDYRPFGTEGDRGNLEAAKEEMRLSRYDTDKDGICDAPECQGVVALGGPDSPGSEVAQSLQANFAEIGIELNLRLTESLFEILAEPSNRIPMNTLAAWGADAWDPTGMAAPVFGSGFIGPKACCNEVLLGASSEQLEEWGFQVGEVESVDEDIARCDAMPLGEERRLCWVELDRKITEEIVPWIPMFKEVMTKVTSENVLSAPWSESTSAIAYEQVVVAS
jgi:peptide/nickel transport system substrate-binding protein